MSQRARNTGVANLVYNTRSITRNLPRKSRPSGTSADYLSTWVYKQGTHPKHRVFGTRNHCFWNAKTAGTAGLVACSPARFGL